MTLARQNAELSQGIDVGSGVLTQTLFVPSDNLVNVSGTITANTGVFDLVEFNSSAELVPTEGQLTWDTTYGTLDIGFSDTYALHVGQETNFRVRNETGGTLYKGQAVAAIGVHNDNIRLEIDKYTADGNTREVRFIGLLSEDIGDNGSGYTTNFGYIRGNSTYTLDTRGSVESPIAVGDETWTQGDILYVHPTVAGKLTKVEPQHSISVGIVIRVHQTDGVILVRPTSYGHLSDNHDVNTSGVVNNDFLKYNSSTENWEPTSTGIFDSLGVGTTPTAQFHVKNESITDKLLLESVDGGATREEYIFNLQTSGVYYDGIVSESGNSITDESGNLLLGDASSVDFASATFPLSGLATSVDCSLVGYNITDSGSAGWNIKSMINNTPNLAFVGSESMDSFVGPAMTGVDIGLSLDAPNSLNVVVTGVSTAVINWAGTIKLTNVH